MANEAIMYEKPTRYARYTVADGTGIEKGTILKLTSPNTAIASAADNDPVAGIAMFEKVASDGMVEITAALDGVWGLLTTAAAITVGNKVVIADANTIAKHATLDDEKGYVLGRALETIGSAVTVIKVRVDVK